MRTRYRCLNCGTALVKEDLGDPLIMSRAEAVRKSGMSKNQFIKEIQPHLSWRMIGNMPYCEVAEFLVWYRSLKKVDLNHKSPREIAQAAVA